jgi:signal recognition particle subunit SRP19
MGSEKSMRKQDKIIIWPAYFDSTKLEGEGRRIPKSLAVPSPKITEIRMLLRSLVWSVKLVLDASYPKTPWLKTGMLLVRKSESKRENYQEDCEKPSKNPKRDNR